MKPCQICKSPSADGYFVSVVPGDGRIEVSKEFFAEIDGRIRTGQRCELSLVLR